TLKAHLQRLGVSLNPTYGEPFCKLAILESDPAAVPTLAVLLRDKDVCIRRLAAAALANIGPAGHTAFPHPLQVANRDDDVFLRGIARTILLDMDLDAAHKAGIVDHFICWSPQPRLVVTIQGSFFLNSPAPLLADGKVLAWDEAERTIALRERAT